MNDNKTSHYSFKRYLIVAALLVSTQTIAASMVNQPLGGFSITDYEGFLSLRYLYDELQVSDLGSTQQHDSKPTYQQELSINSNGFAYHPNFLSFNVGASLLLDQSTLETDQDTNSSEEELLGFNTRLDFLKKKAYPFTVYYSKENPSVSTGLSGHFVQENERYGLDLSILNPVTPVQITFKTFRENANGDGFEQIIDEEREQSLIKFYYSYGSGDYAQFTYQENELLSNSGSPNLPIVETITSGSSSSLDTRNKFGESNQVQLTTNLSHRVRDQYPVLDELSFSPLLSWKHSDSLDSYYQLNYSDLSEEVVDTEKNIIRSGVVSRTENFSSGVNLTIENTDSSQIQYDNMSVTYDLSNTFKFNKTDLTLNYKASYDNREQQSETGIFSVLSEEHILQGTTPVELNRDYIDEATIRVFNESRTQEFQETSDYRIIKVGVKTEIQRVVEGSILDGQRVLVDYDYLTGGDFSYDIAGHHISATWTFAVNTDAYVRYRQIDQSLNDGNLNGIELNSVDSIIYGVKSQRVLLNGMKVGGEIIHEDHKEDISPYLKDSVNYFIEIPLSRQTNIRLSGRNEIKEIEFSDEDSDLQSYMLRVKSRPALRVTSSFESSYERDTGGTSIRETRSHRLLVKWRMRQLSFNANARYAKEQLGTIERDRWEAWVELRRDFF